MPETNETNGQLETCERCGHDECQCITCCGCGNEFDPETATFCTNCELCEGCCECRTCSRSRCRHPVVIRDSFCDNCDRCLNCCDCVTCGACGCILLDSEDFCEACESCNDCCECDCNAVEFIDRADPKFHSAKKSEFTLNNSRRYISCELEFSEAKRTLARDINQVVKKWKSAVVEDGSLPRTGFEINTAPANGDLFVRQIKELCDALQAQSAQVNHQCGFHVHIDSRDMNYWDIRKLCLLYEKLEPALFSVVPPSRRENENCESCGGMYVNGLTAANKKIKSQIIRNVYDNEPGKWLDRTRREKYNSHRYYALNLHSWFYRGTIECRLAAGTSDCDKIVNWGMLWATIIDYAVERKEADIKNLPADSFAALLAVAPTETVREWLTARRDKFRK